MVKGDGFIIVERGTGDFVLAGDTNWVLAGLAGWILAGIAGWILSGITGLVVFGVSGIVKDVDGVILSAEESVISLSLFE